MTPHQVRQARASLGLSQESFAGLLGVGRATVANWEIGRHTPSAIAVRAIRDLASQQEHSHGKKSEQKGNDSKSAKKRPSAR